MIDQVDHIESAYSLMLSQFDNSPKTKAILASWLSPLNDLEDDLIAFMAANGVSNATYAMLDIIGEWVGVYREGRVDSEYRQAILSRCLLEGADGTTERFLSGLRALCRTNYVTFYDYYPATTYAVAGDGYNNSTIEELRRIAPAGVHVRLLMDNNLDSFITGELIGIDNSLVTGNGEEYIVVVDAVEYTLAVSEATGDILGADGDIMAELFDEEYTPLAELTAAGYKVVNNFLIDDNGNYLVDNNGDRITITILG